MARMTKEQAIKRIVAGLHCSEDEAIKVYEYDQAVERGEKTEFDLSPEQQKVVKKMTRAERKPTVYKLETRKRKPNATKGAIIAALAAFLEQTDTFSAENVEIVNAERQIKFKSGGEMFELTLVQKRKPKT